MTATRLDRERWGRRAEVLAGLYLMLKGYRILGRRARTPAGEIDLVAARGQQLVFVEVKARVSADNLPLALPPQARQRLLAAANALGRRYSAERWPERRFDVIMIQPWAWPRHIVNALGSEPG